MVAACRSCGSRNLHHVLSLGTAPLANRLRATEAGPDDPRYPLDLLLCDECSLLQLGDSPAPEVIFSDYPYLSSFSDTMVEHARVLAQGLIEARGLTETTPVLEIGSNDGYLLRHFAAGGVPVLGVDPAEAACRRATSLGIETRQAFFGLACADGLARDGFEPAVVVANNVLAHVPDINDVVAGVRRLLPPNGAFVIETPYLLDLVDRLEFDTIYHEHMFYYSVTALRALLGRHGLALNDAERIPIHGGSLRVTAGADGDPSEGVQRLLAEEAAWGVGEPDTYARFGSRVAERCSDLRDLLHDRKRAGRRIAAYGAAAKGVMLLNALGLDSDVLDFVVDRNPEKQGRRLPGSRLEIRAPDELLAAMPDDVLLLAWNVGEEVLDQQSEYRKRGGTFIVPLPELRIV